VIAAFGCVIASLNQESAATLLILPFYQYMTEKKRTVLINIAP